VDLATVIGLVMGSALLIWSVMSGSELKNFINYPSVAIVIGGASAAVLISFPLRSVMGLFKTCKNAFFSRPNNSAKLISDMVSYAEVARRDGILSLENMTKDIDDEFVVRGIQMAVDGIDPELIEQIMVSELESLADRHAHNKGVLDAIGKYAPAFGMIGTLVGLVQMLQGMDDPSKIGPGMAVALLTTLCGAVVANLLAGPLGDKLAKRNEEEMLLNTLIIKGVMSIQSGDNPRIVEQKLKTFLPPSERARALKEEAAA
jgi:chemotaxis protein MotA